MDKSSPSDEALLKQLKAGNKAGLSTLFNRYYSPLIRFGTSITGDRDLAEDVLQEVFFNIWRQREQLNITTSVKSYLYTATRNRAFNQIKSGSRMTTVEDDTLSQMGSYDPEKDDYDESGAETLKEAIKMGVDTLPPKCKAIFELSRYDNMTYKEIAQYLEISEKTVENQVRIALEKLRRYLRENHAHILSLFLLLSFFPLLSQYT